jgi:hypothetical protein
MSNRDYRIPDAMAAEVLAEAARLYTEANKGYSLEDLQQAGLEARIPSDVIKLAVRNVEERQSKEQAKRKQLREYIKKLIYKGIPVGISLLIPVALVSGIPIGISLLIPAALVSSIFIFRPQIDSVISKLLSDFNPDQQRRNMGLQTLTVKVGTLEYFTEQKGLFIAVSDTNHNGVQGIIGTDGYKSLGIVDGKLGDIYKYEGVHNYQIKIIEVGDRYSNGIVTFQIDQQGQQPQNQIQQLQEEVHRLQEEVQRLQEQPKRFQKKLEEVETERDLIKQQLQQKNQQLEQLEQENNRLKLKTQNFYPSSTLDNNKEPEVLLREDFRRAIMGKTMQEVIEAVGRPNSTQDLSFAVFWNYEKKVKDPASGKIGSARVEFRGSVVSEVIFPSY